MLEENYRCPYQTKIVRLGKCFNYNDSDIIITRVFNILVMKNSDSFQQKQALKHKTNKKSKKKKQN